jgi:hypothetical protein
MRQQQGRSRHAAAAGVASARLGGNDRSSATGVENGSGMIGFDVNSGRDSGHVGAGVAGCGSSWGERCAEIGVKAATGTATNMALIEIDSSGEISVLNVSGENSGHIGAGDTRLRQQQGRTARPYSGAGGGDSSGAIGFLNGSGSNSGHVRAGDTRLRHLQGHSRHAAAAGRRRRRQERHVQQRKRQRQ